MQCQHWHRRRSAKRTVSRYWHKASNKKAPLFLPLCFSIPSQFHLLASRLSPLIKMLNNPKSLEDDFPPPQGWDGQQLLRNAARSQQCTDRLTDWLTEWLAGWLAALDKLTFFFFWTEQQRSALPPTLLLAHLLPPVCSIHTAALNFPAKWGILRCPSGGREVLRSAGKSSLSVGNTLLLRGCVCHALVLLLAKSAQIVQPYSQKCWKSWRRGLVDTIFYFLNPMFASTPK